MLALVVCMLLLAAEQVISSGACVQCRPSLAELSWEPEAFTCSQCDAVLYSHHLLDLHLLELHDAFFEAQV